MISRKMTDALNKQINAELYAAYLYMSMASYASFTGFPGAAKWFHSQTQEELTHALRIYRYVNRVGEHAVLGSIEQPPSEFESLMHMFEGALAHEQKVTGMINDLMNLAVSEKDHATEGFLQWFVKEQVEEEEHVSGLLSMLKLAGENGPALLTIDRQLGERSFSMPQDLQGEE